MIKYPKFLDDKNNLIGITATSDSANLDKIDYSIENLNSYGFKIIETSNVRNKSDKFISSSGKARAYEFMEVLEKENVNAIITARGGEFLCDMLPYLHEYKQKLKTLTPKWIQGYSDNSLLNFYITTNYNIATLHGANFGEFAMRPYHKSLVDNIEFLKGKFENNEFVQYSFEKYQDCFLDAEDPTSEYVLNKNTNYNLINGKSKIEISGRLIGGCIDVITQVLGTEFDNTVNFCNSFEEGIIWYIDNCELTSCEFYRRLLQMKNAGYFQNAKGFLIGRTFGKDSSEEFTMEDAIKKALLTLNVPIIMDVDIGHVAPQILIVNGAMAKFTMNGKKYKIVQYLK